MISSRIGAARHHGLSLIELLIAMGLGAFMLIGIISLVASVSNTRTQLARNSEQIENGRYALEMLSDDIALSGFLGKYRASAANYTQPNPCLDASNLAVLGFKHDFSIPDLPAPLMAYAAGDALPSCISALAVAGSEALVLRHVEPFDVTVSSLSATNTTPYFQISGCDADGKVFVFSEKPADLILRGNDCDTVAPIWEYVSRLYYLSACDDCSNSGDGIPTLKMIELAGGALTTQSVVNGVEDIHFRFGLDLDVDASPDCYVSDPEAAAKPGSCAVGIWNPADNWEDVVTVEINVLVRAVEPTFSSDKTTIFDLKRTDLSGNAQLSKFKDKFRRDVFSSVVSIPNVSGAREGS